MQPVVSFLRRAPSHVITVVGWCLDHPIIMCGVVTAAGMALALAYRRAFGAGGR